MPQTQGKKLQKKKGGPGTGESFDPPAPSKRIRKTARKPSNLKKYKGSQQKKKGSPEFDSPNGKGGACLSGCPIPNDQKKRFFGKLSNLRTEAESQQIVVQRPLSCVQYLVLL